MTERAAMPVRKARRKPPKVRGIFERPKGSDLWWIRYTDAGGRERREKAGARGMALSLLAKRKAEVLQGKKLPETLRRRAVLFGELADDAAAYGQRHHALNRSRDYRAAVLKAALGVRAAADITPQEIDRTLDKLAAERSWTPGTRNRHQAFISLAFRLGVDNGKVQANPARLVHRKRESSGRIRWLTVEEEKKLAAVIEANYPDQLPAFLLSLNTGMRRSEQYRRIQWQDVDFEQRRLWVPGSKNGSPRSIPLNDAAARALLALRDRGDSAGAVMRAGKGGHGLLAGEAQKTPREWFENACRKAGLTDYTWHCNRHTFASRLIMASVPLRTVQELMGHKTIAMTCRYAHLAPQHQLDAVRKLDGWALPKSAVAGSNPGGFAGVQTGTKSGTSVLDAPASGAQVQPQVAVQ